MIISIEGSIGAGKTTLLEKLAKHKFAKEHIVFYEPVDEWLKFTPEGSTLSLFELYYADKAKYGFLFQIYILQSRFYSMLNVIEQNPDKLILCERCHITDCKIFARMLHEDKIMTDIEFEIYKKWYDLVCKVIQRKIDAFIYLRVDPSVCMHRIAKRGRKGEEGIKKEYIDRLHSLHEDWLYRLPMSDCLIIEANDDEMDFDSVTQFIDQNIPN